MHSCICAELSRGLHLMSCVAPKPIVMPKHNTHVHSSTCCAPGMLACTPLTTCHMLLQGKCLEGSNMEASRMPTWSDVKSQNLSSASTHSKRMVQPSSHCVLLCRAASTCCAVTPCSSIRPVPPEAAQPVLILCVSTLHSAVQCSAVLPQCSAAYVRLWHSLHQGHRH